MSQGCAVVLVFQLTEMHNVLIYYELEYWNDSNSFSEKKLCLPSNLKSLISAKNTEFHHVEIVSIGHAINHLCAHVCECVCSVQASVPVILSPEGFKLVPQALCSKAVTDNWQGHVRNMHDLVYCKAMCVHVYCCLHILHNCVCARIA